jgi:hypothetical protein
MAPVKQACRCEKQATARPNVSAVRRPPTRPLTRDVEHQWWKRGRRVPPLSERDLCDIYVK